MTLKTYFSAIRPILLIGCGNMGSALAKGWLRHGLPPTALWVVDPAPFDGQLDEMKAAQWVASSSALPKDMHPSVIILAIKPQMMTACLPSLNALNSNGTLVVSVAAGTAIKNISSHFAPSAVISRAMPNTPAAVGKGLTGIYGGANMAANNKSCLHALMEAVGHVLWLDDEAQINSLTAISGSGPAYIFHMVEALAAAAEAEGFTPENASMLARETMIGAAALLDSSESSAGELRTRVTSPGGTTAAALDVLMGDTSLVGLMREAARAARRRSVELSKSD